MPQMTHDHTPSCSNYWKVHRLVRGVRGEELLNLKQAADLRVVKQLQTKFLYCLNCYLTCKESLLEKLLLKKLKKVSLSCMRGR